MFMNRVAEEVKRTDWMPCAAVSASESGRVGRQPGHDVAGVRMLE